MSAAGRVAEAGRALPGHSATPAKPRSRQRQRLEDGGANPLPWDLFGTLAICELCGNGCYPNCYLNPWYGLVREGKPRPPRGQFP